MLVLLFCASATLSAQQPVRFQLTTNSAKTITGPILKWNSEDGVRLGQKRVANVPLSDVVELQQSGVDRPPQPNARMVIFGNGDCVAFDEDAPISYQNRTLSFQPRQTTTVADVSIRYVAMVWRNAPKGVGDSFAPIRRLLAKKRTKDVVHLQNGDRIECLVQSFRTNEGCRIKIGDAVATIPSARIALIAFDNRLLSRMNFRRAHPFVVLRDGTRLSCFSLRYEEPKSVFEGKTLFGSTLSFKAKDIAAIQMRNGAAVYLSDLKPARYEHIPFWLVKWPLATNANVYGGELKVGDQTFCKGLGMHSKSRVEYNLAGEFRWLQAQVGLDAQRAKRGRVRIQIAIDGKSHFPKNGKSLQWGNGPAAVQIDVRNARTLTLMVDYNGFANVQGSVNWGDARLLQ